MVAELQVADRMAGVQGDTSPAGTMPVLAGEDIRRNKQRRMHVCLGVQLSRLLGVPSRERQDLTRLIFRTSDVIICVF